MIEAYALTERYGERTAVEVLSFTVRPGAVTGIGRSYAANRAPLHEVGAMQEARAIHTGRSADNHLLTLAAIHTPPCCPNPLLRGDRQLCRAALRLSHAETDPASQSLTCDNSARYAKTGQFDPDSTQHALAATPTSRELQGCKFCWCTTQESTKNWRVHQ
jgi:hypothetical protein